MKDYPRQVKVQHYTQIKSSKELSKYVGEVDLVEQIRELKEQLAALHRAIKPLRGRIGDMLRGVIEDSKKK